VGGQFVTSAFITNPYFYPAGTSTDAGAYSVVAIAKLAGKTKWGQVYCAEAPVCAQNVPRYQNYAKQLGLEDVYDGAIAATAPNYTAQCLAAKQAGVEAFFIANTGPVIARVGTDCSRQDFHPMYITKGNGTTIPELEADGIKDNTWMAWQAAPYFADIPAVHQMTDAIKKYSPDLLTNKDAYGGPTPLAWSSALMLGAAAKAGGLGASDSPSPELILKGLNSFKGETLDGMSPPLTFTEGTPHLVPCWFVSQTLNGKSAMANNGQVQCMPAGS
jgi:branched-chain amino acid transport system substrate-binding protein